VVVAQQLAEQVDCEGEGVGEREVRVVGVG
jgi:hypothetical protein